MSAATHAHDSLDEFVAELHHADTLITEQAEQIGALDAEVTRLRARRWPTYWGRLHERPPDVRTGRSLACS